MVMIATIETARLILRPVTLNDAQDFFELDSNPEVHKYLGKNPVSNIAQSKEMIENILYQYKKYKLGRLAVIEKATGKFVGWSGLKYETNFLVDTNYYDLGYRLKEEFWGKGYATETTIKL